jgi:hypothetical protein
MKINKQLIFEDEEIDIVKKLFSINNDKLKELGFKPDEINKIWELWEKAFDNND